MDTDAKGSEAAAKKQDPILLLLCFDPVVDNASTGSPICEQFQIRVYRCPSLVDSNPTLVRRPDDLVHLHLKPHWKCIRNDVFGEILASDRCLSRRNRLQ